MFYENSYDMEKHVKISEVFKLGIVIEKMIKQQSSLSINTAYKLYKLYQEIDDVEKFVFERMSMIFGKDIDFTSMDDKQKTVYAAIMDTPIKIVSPSIDMSEFTDNKHLQLAIPDVVILDKFLN